MADSVYVLDASAWISVEGNPAHNRILYFVLELIEQGKVICPPQAWQEMFKCVCARATYKPHKKAVVKAIQDPEYFLLVGQVARRFPGMAKPLHPKERADAFVVAMAAYLNATSNPTRHIAVANESAAQRQMRKMPTACAGFGVECITLEEMLQREFPDEGF